MHQAVREGLARELRAQPRRPTLIPDPCKHRRTTLTLTALLATSALTASNPTPKQETPAAAAVTVDRGYEHLEASRSYRRPTPPPASPPVDVAPAPKQAPPPPPPPPAWVKPLDSYRLTSCYQYRWGAMHYGIDMATRSGTPIRSVGAGTVVQAGWRYGGYGITVTVDHGGGWHTLYAHANRALVRPGQHIAAGQPIALVGSTGFSTGPHLHFAVIRGSTSWPPSWVNPVPWLAQREVRVGGC